MGIAWLYGVMMGAMTVNEGGHNEYVWHVWEFIIEILSPHFALLII